MSYPRDCSSCSAGDHTGHDPQEGSQPGLIGGTVCECKGDCAERFKARGEVLREKLRGIL